MFEKINHLGFVSLSEFVIENISPQMHNVDCSNIWIKCSKPVPVLNIQNNLLSTADLLNSLLDSFKDNNQFTNGYNKTEREWYGLNTTRNIFKSHQWNSIFKAIGNEYSTFILTNSILAQKIDENFVILCGDTNTLNEQKKYNKTVDRNILFKGRCVDIRVLPNKAILQILGNLDENEDKSYIEIKKTLLDVISKYNKLPTNSLFNNYFSKELKSEHTNLSNDLVQPEKIINFLFMISKKMLKPVFTYKAFKVLKGKLTLLLYRNYYETLNESDLLKYLSTTKLKLFERTSIDNSSKISILSNFMIWLFDSIYLKLIAYYFYSTITANTKRKIQYYLRIHWNNKISKHYNEYLSTFCRVNRTNTCATLRCIPKDENFRVITNCSNVSAYLKQMQDKQNSCFGDKELVDIYSNIIDSKSLKLANLIDKYNDLNDVIKTQTKPNMKTTNINKTYTKAFTINSKAVILIPVLKNIFKMHKGYSLLRHTHIKDYLYSYLENQNKRLFMLKVDLKQCYDNIPQEDLLKLLETMLIEDEYFYQELQLFQFNVNEKKLEKKTVRRICDMIVPMNHREAQPNRKELTCSFNSGYLIKEAKLKTFTNTQIYKMLQDIVQNTVIKHKNTYYRKSEGIPQGCSISSLLCAIYFAYLDKHFSDLKCFIVRYVDDFLLISDKVDDLHTFLRLAEKLQSKGIVVNFAKVNSNVELNDYKRIEDNTINEQKESKELGFIDNTNVETADISIKNSLELNKENSNNIVANNHIFKSNFVDWCGFRIFDHSFAIKSICADPYFVYTISIHSTRRGKQIESNIKKILAMKLTALLINPRNKKTYENLYDASLYVARKMKILFYRAEFINEQFISGLLDMIRKEIEIVCRKRRVRIDSEKQLAITQKAFEKSRILNVKQTKNFNK